MKKYYNNYMRV